MEKIDELRLNSTALNSSPSFASVAREEGELSSSDNDTEHVQPACSTAPALVVAPTLPVIPQQDKTDIGIQAEKAAPGNKISTSVDVGTRTSIQITSQKTSDNDQVIHKTGTLAWGASREANSNLVISFSDDSGSDLEEGIKEKTLKSCSTAIMHQKPPASLLPKSYKIRHTTRNKVISNKLSSNHSFIASTTKTNGVNSKGAGPKVVEQGSRSRNFNGLNGKLLSQGRGIDQGVNLNSNKLRDLREQIAIRESKLKLKSAQPNKETGSVIFRDHNVGSSKNDLGKNRIATSSQFPPLELREPGAKRLKMSGSYSTKLSSGERQDLPQTSAAKSVLLPQGSGAETHNTTKVTYSQKGIPMSREEFSIIKQKKEDNMHVAASPGNIPGVQDGTNINCTGNQSDWSSKHVAASPVNIPAVQDGTNINCNGNQSDWISKQDNDKFHSQNDGPQPSVSTTKKLEGMLPQPASNIKIPETSVNFFKSLIINGSTGNPFCNSSCSDNSNFDLQSLFEMEESLEKDLEEAQDSRRQCEIEERNAFKIYCTAQRALVHANARCLDLYHKRELYSAHFRSFCMNNPSLISSTRHHEDVRIGVDHSNHMSENANEVSPSYQEHPECNGFAQPQNDTYIQNTNSCPINTPNLHVNGQILVSEPDSYSELRGNALDPVSFRGKNAADRICSPSTDPNVIVDGDESFPYDHEVIGPCDECHTGQKHSEDEEMDMFNVLKKNHSANNTEDSLRLEAKLRTELFARLGTRNLLKVCGPCYSNQPTVEKGTENDARDGKTQLNNTEPTVGRAIGNGVDLRSEITEINNGSDLPLKWRDQQFGFGGMDICKTPDEIQNRCHFENLPLDSHYSAESAGNELSNREGRCSKTSSFTPSMTFNSVFQHLKAISSVSSEILLTRARGSLSDQIHWSKSKENSIHETVGYMFEQDGSYTHDLAVDPFWPLCMYELRGKCNNDECPWQHVKDYCDGYMKHRQYQHEHTNHSDSCHGLSLTRVETKVAKYEDLMTPPTYLVGIDIIKADAHSYDSVLVRRNSQCWQNFFSISLTLPNLIQKGASTNGLFLHDVRIEANDSWKRQSSYFQSGSATLSQLKQADEGQTLETALLIINQEVNKREGMKKALPVLSRAVENNPTSVALWTVYLLIYYSYSTSGGDDDMFSYAVKHNGLSYELWLMYINSRMNINDRLAAYDAALSALCHNGFNHDLDGNHASAYILDLILQTFHCLCISGNVEEAIRRIFGLLQVAMDSDEPYSFTHSDILTCLNISDKCIFWVCVVYLVIYRKLPDVIVQQFECEKEPVEIEWPTIQLTDGEKQRASGVVKKALDFVDSCLTNESLGRYKKSAQMFAANHIRCLIAIDGIECGRNLLDKYVKLHPSCLELVLLFARVKECDSGDATIIAFEEALKNWPEEVPGVQCIWNQYAEYLLQNGRFEYAKELMIRWFNSAWKVDLSQTGMLNHGDYNSGYLLESASESILHALDSHPNEMDAVFQYLNLSVHKLLQNDQFEARLAFENALKAASPGTFKYCMREYAMFLLTDESFFTEVTSMGGIRSILEGHLNDVRAFPVPNPLSRKFINDIKKPRVRQLVSNMLSPLSPDVSLVNCILEVWYGPSLLPPKFSKSKELVDFVETVLEMLPSNYQLALSVCKKIYSDNDSFQVVSASLIFWASSNLINAIFNAVPIPPEFVWVEASNILVNFKGLEAITERFHKRALSVYPFSVQLWKHYYNMCKNRGDTSAVMQAVKEKGIKLT